jgi:hypothetical protein
MTRNGSSSRRIGRQALNQVGFDFVVEAGLGRGHRDFRALRLHTLPASPTAMLVANTLGSGELVGEAQTGLMAGCAGRRVVGRQVRVKEQRLILPSAIFSGACGLSAGTEAG